MKPWLSRSLGLPAALVGLQLFCGAAFAAGFYASPARQDSGSADVGIDGQGNITFSWTTFHEVTGDILVQWRTRTAAGALGAPQTLSGGGHDNRFPHVAVNGAGAAVAVWRTSRGNLAATTPVQGRARTAGGALGPIFTVSAKPGGAFSFDFANPIVAIDAAGNATFAWTGLDGEQKRRAYARRRSAGGVFGPIVTLSPPGVSDPRMDVNAGGDAVFVWVWNNGAGQNQIQARLLSAAGTLGPLKIIGQGIAPSGGGGAGTVNPRVGVDGQGNALIVWEQPDDDGPCGINGCPKVLARTLSSNGTLGVPQTMTTTVTGGVSPQVAMASNGRAVVTWVHAGIEFRTRSAAGALGPVRTFSTTTTSVSGLVLKGDPAGNVVAVWKDGPIIRARARSVAGTLGPLQRYSIAGQVASGGVLAVGTGGDAVVAWDQPDGLGQCFGGSSCNRVGAAVDP